MITIEPVTLAVSSICLVGFALPFVYYSYKLKKQASKNLSTFEEFVAEHNITPTQHEYWRNHYHLGLDPDHNKLVYHRFGSYPEQNLIDLNEVDKVHIQEKVRRVEVGKEKRYILEFLALQFHFRKANHPPKTIEIYDGALFTGVAGERAIANKWLQLIERQLSQPAQEELN